MRITQTLRKRESDVSLLDAIDFKENKSTFSAIKVIVKFDMHSYPNLLGVISMGSEDESMTIQKSWLSLSRVNRDYLLQRENEQSVTI